MNDTLQFATRGEFRAWLEDHCLSEEGIWLVLGKAGGPKTIKAGEALEEALCFGWIDGQMQSLDDKTYRKYFSQRRGKSKWSEKNKQPVSYTHLLRLFRVIRLQSLFRVGFLPEIPICAVKSGWDIAA